MFHFYALKISTDDYFNSMHIIKIYLRHIRKYVKSKDHVPGNSYADSFKFVTSLHCSSYIFSNYLTCFLDKKVSKNI